MPRLDFKGLTRIGAALALVAGLTGAPAVTDALGQIPQGEEAAGKADAANQRAYTAGIRAFESGDMATAERQFTTALAGGGLPSAQMARALYLRGSASRRLGKPAQAISDLTTAVWLKGGLSDSDKAKAMEERQLAYREAGLGDTPPPIGAAPLDQSPSTPTPGAPQAKPGTQVAVVGPSSFWNNVSLPSLPSISIPGLSSSSSAPAQPAAPPAAAAPPPAQGFAAAPAPDVAEAAAAGQAQVQGFAATEPVAAAQTSAWATETAPAGAAAQSAPPQQVAAGFAPQATPVSTGLNTMPGASPAGGGGGETDGSTWNPLAGTGQAIGGFFGNMFGSSEASETGGVTTGSTAGGAEWGSETTVVNAQTSSMVQRGPDSSPSALPWSNSGGGAASAQPTAAKQVAAKPAGGNFKLQVASVRSREEADKLAETLQRYPAVRDGSVRTEVDEAVIGSMGTFYRVRLGPYPNAKEPGELCQTLKPQGFDCLVVTQ